MTSKPGRNTPCHCGSGRKFKHCHGRLDRPASPGSGPPPEIQAALTRALREHDAKEIVRQRQQGFGKPIISGQDGEFRLVVVGNKVCWSKGWVYFTDFLIDHLKDNLGRSWGQAAQGRGVAHPVFRWLSLLKARTSTDRASDRGMREVGYLTSLFRLAYALYLIAHNDRIAPSLIKRLQNPRDDIFRPAMYETLVAASFAVAGYKIEGAEHIRTNRKTPEFWATSVSGVRYAVEAKCKLVWKSPTDVNSSEFQGELRAWLRDKLYDASSKRLPSPVFWFELSIPTEFGEPEYRKVQEIIISTLREAETLTIGGELVDPAYVFVTNHSHLVSDEVLGAPFFAVLEGYRKPDMNSGRQVSLEEAFEVRDRHREITRVFECLSDVQRVPQTFDGEPVELLGPHGQTGAPLKIGEPIHLEFPNGQALAGILSEIAVSNDVAWVFIQDPEGKQRMATMPLTEAEVRAVKEYGLAVFGKPEGPRQDLANDPIKIYDWVLQAYAEYPRDALLRQIPNHRDFGQIADLSLPEMRKRVAREVAKGMHSLGQRREAREKG